MSGRGGPGIDIVQESRPCDQLSIVSVVLANVDLEVSAKTSAGDSLPVALVNNRYPVVMRGPDALGSIVQGALSELVRCLREGAQFQATVLEVDGALVRVRVAPA